MSATRVVRVLPGATALFVCDIQTAFNKAIYGFDAVVSTTRKMVRFAKLLDVPVLVTEQNPKALGRTVESIGLAGPDAPRLLTPEPIAKKKFSMVTPEAEQALKQNGIKSVALLGIESHICVLQTALDLLERGVDVHMLADGVSSCNRAEVPLALERLRQAGAVITTSDAFLYQYLGDASDPRFKAFAGLVKEEKGPTIEAVEKLLSGGGVGVARAGL